MKLKIAILMISTFLMSCGAEKQDAKLNSPQLTGTWKLLTATLIEKGDTTVTDYTKDLSFIKIINDTHFAFLQHDLNKGKDSAAVFVSGGGKYTLKNNSYTEHLEYCSARNWEGNDFVFTITLKNDTLVQSGLEKVEAEGVNRVNIEKYVRWNE
ncbi:hypothetical protein GZH53_08055 [Flavihumibacter sp. R14]|nr:hypothetical protein [Flavihumibacter soli]